MKTQFKYGGGSYCTLRYAKSCFGKPITVSKVMDLFSHKFDKPSRALESLDRLTRHGYLKCQKDGWVITHQGSEYLRMTARPFYDKHD